MADQGDARAQNNLGVAYMLGQGVEQDSTVAASFFRSAAIQGFGAAQANIAESYFKGEGVPQDYVLAARWARLGAIYGDYDSQFYMGELSLKDLGGVVRDPLRAYAWYSISAENGNEQASVELEALSAKLNDVERSKAEKILKDCKTSMLNAC